MNKPKEFWLYLDNSGFRGVDYVYRKPIKDTIHVIEKSAADKLAEALEETCSHSFYCPYSEGKGFNKVPDECPACDALKEYRGKK